MHFEAQRLIEFFIISKKSDLAEITIKKYNTELSKLFKYTGKEPSEVTSEDINDYFANELPVAKPTYVNGLLKVYSSFYNYLILENILTKSPITKWVKRKCPKKKFKALGNEQQALLKIASEELNLRIRCMYNLFLTSGIRKSELIGTNIEDIDLDKGFVTIFGKGDKYRDVGFSEEAKYLIKKLIANRKSGPLFLSSLNRRISKTTITRDFAKLCAQANVKIYPHKLRHTYATILSLSGEPVINIKNRLGHEDLKTTEIYIDKLPFLSQKRMYNKHKR